MFFDINIQRLPMKPLHFDDGIPSALHADALRQIFKVSEIWQRFSLKEAAYGRIPLLKIVRVPIKTTNGPSASAVFNPVYGRKRTGARPGETVLVTLRATSFEISIGTVHATPRGVPCMSAQFPY